MGSVGEALPDTNTKRFVLSPGTELRLELHDGKQVTVELVDGRAELFGAELHTGEPLTRTGPPFAVFTWTGATLHVGAADGTPLSTAAALVYVADETPAAAYVNVHDGLEARRQAAAAASEEGAAAAAPDAAPDAAAATTRSPHDGPRAIVVGPVDAGKSTLVRTLANYAVRAGWAPLLIDLDVGQGALSPPGTVAAAPVDAPLCAGAPPGAAAGVDAPDAPLVFWYGAPSPGDNPDLFRFVVDRLAGLLARRAASSARSARAAGWLVNWMGWVDDVGYDLLRHAIDALGVDVVLVVGHDRLFARLQAELSATTTTVVKLPRSEGAVARDGDARRAGRAAAVKTYFYGPAGDLAPASLRLRADEMCLYRAGGGPRAPSTALPIGAAATADPRRVEARPPGPDLLHSLLAVSHAIDPADLLACNVAGFLYVTGVERDGGAYTVLAPRGGALPGKLMLAGNIKVFLE